MVWNPFNSKTKDDSLKVVDAARPEQDVPLAVDVANDASSPVSSPLDDSSEANPPGEVSSSNENHQLVQTEELAVTDTTSVESAAPKKRTFSFLRKPKQAMSIDDAAEAVIAQAQDTAAKDEGPELIASPTKGSKWGFFKREKAVNESTGTSDAVLDDMAKETSATSGRKFLFNRKDRKAKPSAIPIRVIIGFLPEITERDAREYALGIAEKHFEQMSLAFSDAFPYNGGFAFEAHEGGEGKAYLPEIIEYFESQGPFRNDQDVSVVIKTATRNVQVMRTREGLTAVVLPETSMSVSVHEPTEWLSPRVAMAPVINTRTGFLLVCAAIFTTGFMGMMISSMLTRFQTYDPPPTAQVEFLRSEQLPASQWRSLENISDDSFVRALRFRNGRWEPPEIIKEAPPPTPDSVTDAVSDPAAVPDVSSAPEGATPSGTPTP